jgi:hypothetical protein
LQTKKKKSITAGDEIFLNYGHCHDDIATMPSWAATIPKTYDFQVSARIVKRLYRLLNLNQKVQQSSYIPSQYGMFPKKGEVERKLQFKKTTLYLFSFETQYKVFKAHFIPLFCSLIFLKKKIVFNFLLDIHVYRIRRFSPKRYCFSS